MRTEFDTMEEWEEAMKNLSAYHNCEKCRGKIVAFAHDGLGNTKCGYCGEIVKYPRLKRGVFEEHLKTLQ